MDAGKLKKITDFRNFLVELDARHMEHSIGHFTIYNDNGTAICCVWPSTQRLVVAGTDEVIRGTESIEKYLTARLSKAPVTNVIRQYLLDAVGRVNYLRKIVTVTELPSGALETQINDGGLASKYQYIVDNYDEDMKLKTCPDIQIVGLIII